MPDIEEIPSDEPLPCAVGPVLFGECDVIGWAALHNFKGMRDSIDGLGPFFAVELRIETEVAVLFEYDERPGELHLEVRLDLFDREFRSVEWLRALSISGSFTGTGTGTAYLV